MIVRRLLILVAVLMAVTAVAVALDPGREDTPATEDQARIETSPTPAAGSDDPAPAERDPAAPGESPIRTMDAAESGQEIRVRPGERIRIRVLSDELEPVQLGDDGPVEVVDPESPAEFEVLAEDDLAADVRLLESGRTIGRVTTEG